MDLEVKLKDELEKAVRSGRTLYAVAKAADMKPDLLYRFASGERDLLLKSAAKLAGALGLTLTALPPVEGGAKKAPGTGRKTKR